MGRSVASLLRPGDRLVSGQTLSEPTVLLREVFRTTPDIRDLHLFGGMTLTGVFAEAPPGFGLSTFVGLGGNTELIANGRMALVPCHMSHLPWSLAEGPLQPDVVLVQVSPPDRHGTCHLGLAPDYIWSALPAARVVLAEINEQVPRIGGDTALDFDRIDAAIRTDRPLPEQATARPNEVERAIAANVAPFIHDGTCLQIGVGRLGEAILEAVAGRRRLGVHCGMIGDTMLELVEAGVVTNAGKPIDTGLTVAGSVLGSHRAVELAARCEALRLRSVAYTNDPAVVSQLGDVVCINSAIEVDLYGQVNAEAADGRYVGGIGGSVDFLRGAVRAGGRSIVALPATARRGTVSRIVPTVQRVTALRSDVDMVATEYGIAELRGVSTGERMARLVEIAAPDHREGLRLAAKELRL